jgi:hypothetical protein
MYNLCFQNPQLEKFMSVSRSVFDLKTMELSLSKNKKDLEELSRLHRPKTEWRKFDLSGIDEIVTIVSATHSLIKIAKSSAAQFVQDANCDYAMKGLELEVEAKSDENLALLESKSQNLIDQFPADVRAQVLLTTNAMKKNLTASQSELKLAIEDYKHSVWHGYR